MRYVNEYIDGLLVLSAHIFKEVCISWCDQISCKAHMVGERMHKVFGLIGLNSNCHAWPMGNIKLP